MREGSRLQTVALVVRSHEETVLLYWSLAQFAIMLHSPESVVRHATSFELEQPMWSADARMIPLANLKTSRARRR